jgi:hypothetical protein
MTTVRVLVFSSQPQQAYLEFRLIFPGGFEKYYKLDDYQIRQFRGLNERAIIAEMAMDYFEQNNEHVDELYLQFL